jgi:hypothetical protein
MGRRVGSYKFGGRLEDAVRPSVIWIKFYQALWSHIPYNRYFHSLRHENRKASYKLSVGVRIQEEVPLNIFFCERFIQHSNAVKVTNKLQTNYREEHIVCSIWNNSYFCSRPDLIIN